MAKKAAKDTFSVIIANNSAFEECFPPDNHTRLDRLLRLFD